MMCPVHFTQLMFVFSLTVGVSQSADHKNNHFDSGENGGEPFHSGIGNAHPHGYVPFSTIPSSNSSVIPQPIYPDCNSFMMEVGQFSSDFFKCSVQHSRPFRMCQNCVAPYMKTYSIYQEITKDDKREDACAHLLLNSDRVMVITQVVNSVTDMWKFADCPKCFDTISEDENGTVHHTLSNDTITFLNMYYNMSVCLSFNASEIDPYDATNINNSACIACRTQYNEMNNFFIKMLNNNNQHVCMDIVDMMNYTRIEWSQTFHCSHRSGYDAPIILITIIMCALTFLFYCVNLVVAQRKERKLMKQKRLTLTVDKRLPNFPQGSVESDLDRDEGIYGNLS